MPATRSARFVLSAAIALAALASTPSLAAAEAAQAPATVAAPASALTLTVRNVRPGAGTVMIVLFDSEAAWKGQGRPVRAESVTAAGAEVAVTFAGLKPGAYGVKLYQDLDGDGRMGANPFGIPTEPYAFSNDAPVRFGPPDWQAAQFAVDAGAVAHAIKLPE